MPPFTQTITKGAEMQKVAVITAGGSGMGAAAARRLAADGFAVAILSSSGKGEALATELGGVGITGSNQSNDDVQRLVDATMARFGRIDVLVNNVGGSAAGGPVEMSEAVWDAQIDHNLKSVFLGCKHVLPIMAAQGAGAIVNIASTSGMRWTGAAQVAYAATKAGVIQLVKVVAVQYAKQGIRVNTVVPGQLHTPMVETRLAGQRAGGDVQSLLQARQARIPLPFMGDGRDTARAVLFLASEEARFITGTEIVVDGGMSVRCD